MRPIKFRVKLNENSANPGIFIYVVPWEFRAWEKVDLDTISQFTGIYDKNNKEIYEGDILIWDKENYGRIEVICGFDYYLLNQYSLFNHTIEVLGNIHENPEILCDHEYENNLLLSFPPKIICKKCNKLENK